MSKKKIIIGILIIVVVLGYLNYFSDEKIKQDPSPKIVTTNVEYENDDYKVKAQKQIDYVKTKDTEFDFADLLVKGRDLKLVGDTITIDKDNNAKLRGNIKGNSPEGWDLESQSLNYSKILDEITSDTGLTATNKEKEVRISSTIYKSDSKVTFIDLEKNVTLDNFKIKAVGDKGRYSQSSGHVVMSDNIVLSGHDKNNEPIDGNFQYLDYQIDEKILTSNQLFDLTYKGITLSGENIWYNETLEAFNVTKNVSFSAAGYKVYVDKIEKKENNDIVDIYGKIHGGNEKYTLNADRGEYNIKTKELHLLGNVAITSTDNEKLTADEIVMSNDTKMIIARVKESENVVYVRKDGTLKTKEIKYNFDTGEIFVDNNYDFAGPVYESKGDLANYNSTKKVGHVENGYILNRVKNQRLSGNKIDLDGMNEIYIVDGNASIENKTYKLNSDKITHNNKSGKAVIDGEYTIDMIGKDVSYKGKDATYDATTGEFLDSGLVKIVGKTFEAYGEDLRYNNKNGDGTIKSQIVFKNEDNGTTITGQKFSFQKDEFVKITDGILIENDTVIANSKEGIYDLKSGKINIPSEMQIDSKDKTFTGNIANGIYDVNKGTFYGNTFKGKYMEYDLQSDNVEYRYEDGKMSMVNNARIESTIDKNKKVYGNRLEYASKTKIIDAIGDYTAYYDEYIIKGTNIVYDDINGTLKGGKFFGTSTTGDTFQSNTVDGLVREMRVDFIGHARSTVTRDNKVTNFTGERVRLYLKNINGNYTAIRSEVKGDPVFTQEDKKLSADYMEYDIEKKLLYAKDNLKLTSKDDKNGYIQATSERGRADTAAETAVLNGKVYIKNIGINNEITEIHSENAEIDNNKGILTLTQDVRVDNPKGILTADRATYDLNTKKAKAKGNVYVEYKNKK